MGRYQLGDKIWSIQRHDTAIAIVEPDGTERTEELADVAATSLRFAILTNQKLKAGWKLVRDTEPAATGLVTASNVFDARNIELERQLIADPESRETWLVYGDWLQQQGDPRGEVIAKYAAAMLGPDQRGHADELEQALKRHRRYLEGMASVAGRDFEFRWGFIYSVQVNGDQAGDHLGVALSHGSTRMVGAIEVDTNESRQLAIAVDHVANLAPATLRSLTLVGTASLSDLASLASRLPTLQQFNLLVPLVGGSSCLELVVATPWPELESLGLSLSGEATVATVRPLLDRRDLSKLRAFRLEGARDPAAFDLLAPSHVAAQVEKLTLPFINDAATPFLLDSLAAFPKLTTLELPLKDLRVGSRRALAARVSNVVQFEKARHKRYQRYVPTGE